AVVQDLVRLLYPRGDRGGDDQLDVTEAAGLAAVLAEEAGGHQALFLRQADGAEQVGAVAAGRHGDQHVARIAERLDLAREDVVEAEIVAGAGDDRRVAE